MADESLENDEVVKTNYEDLPLSTITRYKFDLHFTCNLMQRLIQIGYRNIIQNRTSETNLKNLKLLEDFPYDYEFQKKLGKRQTCYRIHLQI